ncbi:DUF1761 family protein [Altererythrobacter marinus]|uniref:DUF1761 family protein n=1 Tax=Pelagerythrobacter marinus TaxID=538382 RepID=A0ABW9UZA0_9SPHN|nr:DUF1761 domain-containing protein [Pelagerythrobacter marinus]MXO69291.1 DUF1761 family protein [Pelagerythrobacter marinus]
MGPIDWTGAIAATLAAGLIALAWYGPIFGMAKARKVAPGKIAVRRRPEHVVAITGGLLFLSAAMMGHMFARVGGETLAAKPWLYFMMSGGLAGAFVIPALLISYSHIRVATRVALIDAGYWLTAYLAMGGVFWLLA